MRGTGDGVVDGVTGRVVVDAGGVVMAEVDVAEGITLAAAGSVSDPASS
jgi:hypothetical protein